MVVIRLPSELENLAKATGRTKTFYAQEAIVAHLDDLEDLYLEEQRLLGNPGGALGVGTLRGCDEALWLGGLSLITLQSAGSIGNRTECGLSGCASLNALSSAG